MNSEIRDARREQEQLDALHRLDEECVHLQRVGNYLQAFDRMERALVLRRHFFGADSPEVVHACKALAEMCNLLSMSFLQQDNYAVTLELLKKAEILSQQHPKEKATTLNNLACYYRRLGKLHTAMTCLKKALAIEKKTLRDVRNAADTHLNICAVLSQLNKHDQALEHAQAALVTLQEEFFRKANTTDTEAPTNATTKLQSPKEESQVNQQSSQLERVSVMCIAYHNMGVEQEFLKDYESCVLSYKKGVGLAEQYLGVDHAITTTIRNSYLAAKRTISTKAGSARHASKATGGNMKMRPLSPQVSTPSGSLRLPSPIAKDKHHYPELPSPRSIVADALARGNTLPPLEPHPNRKKVSTTLSPEDPFFSPRFRFDNDITGSAPPVKTSCAKVLQENITIIQPKETQDTSDGLAGEQQHNEEVYNEQYLLTAEEASDAALVADKADQMSLPDEVAPLQENGAEIQPEKPDNLDDVADEQQQDTEIEQDQHTPSAEERLVTVVTVEQPDESLPLQEHKVVTIAPQEQPNPTTEESLPLSISLQDQAFDEPSSGNRDLDAPIIPSDCAADDEIGEVSTYALLNPPELLDHEQVSISSQEDGLCTMQGAGSLSYSDYDNVHGGSLKDECLVAMDSVDAGFEDPVRIDPAIVHPDVDHYSSPHDAYPIAASDHSTEICASHEKLEHVSDASANTLGVEIPLRWDLGLTETQLVEDITIENDAYTRHEQDIREAVPLAQQNVTPEDTSAAHTGFHDLNRE